MAFKPALTVKKEYAEKPFDLWQFRGTNRQFTIIEDLKVTQNPRMGKKSGTTKEGKAYSFDVACIKVADGLFEKDMQLGEGDWLAINKVRPDNMLTLRGATYAYQGNELTFIGIATPDMNENFTKRAESPKDATNASTLDSRVAQLREAIKLTASLGTTVNAAVAIKIAESIEPGNALSLISSAKNAGEICENQGIFTGTA
jgi:hypothetical protein